MQGKAVNLGSTAQSCAISQKSSKPISEDTVKKTSLFVVLMLIVVIGAATSSFAACTATSLLTTPGIWGIESYGTGPGGLNNILMQVTFASGGTFSGTEWQSVAGSLTSFSISGTWTMGLPVTDCQGTFKVTSPSTQTFNFALNNAAKGGTIAETDANYTMAGFMVAQGTVTGGCSALTFKNKLFSLYSYGTIPAVGGTVSATGEIKFGSTGATFASLPTVTLDLATAGNFTLPATGTSSLSSDCTGAGVLTVTALGQSFDVDTVVVDAGKEALWIVTNAGDNVSGYFLQ
jgi:hypothetical protein